MGCSKLFAGSSWNKARSDKNLASHLTKKLAEEQKNWFEKNSVQSTLHSWWLQPRRIESEIIQCWYGCSEIIGKNFIPGYAKNQMDNSIKNCCLFMESLPKKFSINQETTEKRQGYVQCTTIMEWKKPQLWKLSSGIWNTKTKAVWKTCLEKLAKKAVANFSGAKY